MLAAFTFLERIERAGGPCIARAGRQARVCPHCHRNVARAAESPDRAGHGRLTDRERRPDTRRRMRRRSELLCAPGRAGHRNVFGRQIFSRRRRASRGPVRRSARDRVGALVARCGLSDPTLKDGHTAADRSRERRVGCNESAAGKPDSIDVFLRQRDSLRRSAAAVLPHRNERTHASAGARQSSSLAAVRTRFNQRHRAALLSFDRRQGHKVCAQSDASDLHRTRRLGRTDVVRRRFLDVASRRRAACNAAHAAWFGTLRDVARRICG